MAKGPIGPPPPRPAIPGLRKAALLIAQLSPEEAGQVLAHLKPREVEHLATELVELGKVDPGDVDAVMMEFHDLMHDGRRHSRGGEEFTREILTVGFGAEDADLFLARLRVDHGDAPFASLRNADTRQLGTFLREEHPQLIALVIAHLPAAQAAEVLSALPPEQQPIVAQRIAAMDRAAPGMIQLIEDHLRHRMGALLADDQATSGGIEALVAIVNRSTRPTERLILDRLDTADPELAAQVRARMFVFEDILTIGDRALQQVLRQVRPEDLATALKGVAASVQDKVIRNLSARVADSVADELELLGPVRTSAVEDAQAKVVGVIRAMEASGALTIIRGDDELIA